MASIERTYQTPGELALDLSIPSGWIDVETHDGDETHVVLESDDQRLLDEAVIELRERMGGGHELFVEIERRGGIFSGIEIVIGSGSFGRSKVRLRVRCPHGAALTARTASADVTATGRFSALEAKTASGDVRAGMIDGGAVVNTASGDVRLERVEGEVRAKTVSGDIQLDYAAGEVVAQVISGDVAVRDAASSVTAKSVSGDIRLHAVSSGDMQLTSISGDIEVGIRRGSRLDVDAGSVSGDLSSEVTLSDAPGDAGEGPLVTLRGKTVSGDFKVFRAAAEQHA